MGTTDEAFTLVFAGDIRSFDFNPLTTETPFGVPYAVGIGDAFQELEQLAEATAEPASRPADDRVPRHVFANQTALEQYELRVALDKAGRPADVAGLDDAHADLVTQWCIDRTGKPDNRGVWKARAEKAEADLTRITAERDEARENRDSHQRVGMATLARAEAAEQALAAEKAKTAEAVEAFNSTVELVAAEKAAREKAADTADMNNRLASHYERALREMKWDGEGDPVDYCKMRWQERLDDDDALDTARADLRRMTEALTRFNQWLDGRITELEALFENGKGTWPNSDYVRDDTWNSWNGQLSALRSARHQLPADLIAALGGSNVQ
jgi:hypothetical protein